MLETLEVQSGEQSHKLYKVRNPWGSERYTGDWSDKSSLWTEILKEKHSIKDENDGIWYISAEDYLTNFVKTTVNVDVSQEHLAYFARFEVEIVDDEPHHEKFTVTSEVE